MRPFERPGFPTLAKVLSDAGYVTPKGRALVACGAAASGRSLRQGTWRALLALEIAHSE